MLEISFSVGRAIFFFPEVRALGARSLAAPHPEGLFGIPVTPRVVA